MTDQPMNLSRRAFFFGAASVALIPSLLASTSIIAISASWDIAKISAAICAILEADHDGVIYDWTPEEMTARQLRTNPKENWAWNGKGAVYLGKTA